MLGENLGDFVGENFLGEDVVRDKLARVQVSSRVGAWIGQEANADRDGAQDRPSELAGSARPRMVPREATARTTATLR